MWNYYTPKQGIKFVKISLESYSKWTSSTIAMTTFLALSLTLNNIIFNCRNYLQMKSCAMGTICAYSYAKIFMDHYERQLIYPFSQTFSLTYFRFLGNTILIWKSRTISLGNLLSKLNSKHLSIKFVYEILKERISFLEMKIYFQNNKLYTRVFRKKADRWSFHQNVKKACHIV